MRDLLVGSTGFVGGNIAKKHSFFHVVHATDVTDAYGMRPDFCIYAGVPASMYLANENPDRDYDIVKNARENIRAIKPTQIVLISTVAVYSNIKEGDENSLIEKEKVKAYGRHRRLLEEWVMEDFQNSLIVRLPALYGDGMKKNFIFDLLHIVPQMLREDVFFELSHKTDIVRSSYEKSTDCFYSLKKSYDHEKLKNFFENNDFNSLSFTDSRSRFQFYNLANIWKDINTALRNRRRLVNLITEPLSARAVYEAFTGKDNWKNELDSKPYEYGLKTIYASEYGGKNGWIMDRNSALDDIVNFLNTWSQE